MKNSSIPKQNSQRLIDFCKTFGHKIPTGHGRGLPYGSPKFFAIDGMNTSHYQVFVKCSRCNKEFPVVNFHVPKEGLK